MVRVADRPLSSSASVAAVVVSYNSERYLRTCLRSLAAEGVKDVVVVDNGSVDRSRQVAEDAGAVWVATGVNLGYGRAANVGAAAFPAARSVLVCNPDVRLGEGAVAALVDALSRDPELAVVGPRIEDPDGALYPSARTFPELTVAMGHGLVGLVAPGNRFTRSYRLLDWDHSEATSVDWVSGACFLARREAWEQVGGFDPSYFMYLEDVDLCWRLGRAGWKVGYEPAGVVTHVQGVSTDRRPYRMLAAHHLSMWRFAFRTTSGWRRAVLPVVAAGLVGRLAVASARRRWAGTTGGPRV
jgi:N-acetylglucosaminyl-diphospho-decaprenol L-rhamnosyltransferase